MTTQQALQIALQHHQAGRLGEAEAIYRQVLAVEPRHAGALHLLGVIAHQSGRNEVALDLIHQAIAVNSSAASYHNNLGNVLKELGRMEEASTAFSRAIELQPDYAEAHNNLGNVLAQRGRSDDAVAAYRRALQIQPDYAQALHNLGHVFADRSQWDEVIATYRRVLQFRPDDAEAHCNLGNALRKQGQLDEAIGAYLLAVQSKPDFAEAHSNLGNALRNQDRLDEAIAAHRRAVSLQPENADAHNNLGNALREQGRVSEALAAYRRAITLKPGSAQAHANLGAALRDQGQLDEAIAAHRRALQLEPDLAMAHGDLANALAQQGQLEEAVAAYERALQLQPDRADSWLGLGTNLGKLGSLEQAIAAMRRGLALKPDFAEARSSYLFFLHYLPEAEAPAIFEEHCRWEELHARSLAKGILPHTNERNPARPLRVGYVSADFREHSVAAFFESLLAHHDASQCETFCYSSVAKPDCVTDRLRRLATHWREVFGLSDADVAEFVRQDEIDLLVDLAGHTSHPRLLVFARKPAPVQITWLGYPDTTGLRTMDYRLTDAQADPLGTTERWHTERLVRLPDCAWCFRAPVEAPAVNVPPVTHTGFVTFCCFNVLQKINRPLVAAWSLILQQTPGSWLLLKSPYLQDSGARARLHALLAEAGVVPERVELIGRLPQLADHLATYHRADIALDTFPYHGTTTTCEALWMGVPVVTLAGQTHASRVGVSLLSNVGLAELIARDAEEYVRIAVALSHDVLRLSALRAGLRERMAASPLMDGARFARNIERAYREMWRAWCAAPA